MNQYSHFIIYTDSIKQSDIYTFKNAAVTLAGFTSANMSAI